MVSLGEHMLESYAHILNADRSLLKLNPALEKFGYRFLWINATQLEHDFSELLNIPKSDQRQLTIMLGREQYGISHELHKAIIHNPLFNSMFFHVEYPGILLLQKRHTFKISSEGDDFISETKEISNFYPVVSDILLQLRLFKVGEVRCAQAFHITLITREISLRKPEVTIGSFGDYRLSDDEAMTLSETIVQKYEVNLLTELAVKNFNVAYDLPDGRLGSLP